MAERLELEIEAPARLPLTYEVQGRREKRSDRFAYVAVMQELALHDTLTFAPRTDKLINLVVEQDVTLPLAGESVVEVNAPKGSGNIIVRTANLLRQVLGVQLGADIKLTKRIPLFWGLGGGASDAAATIKGLRQLWELKLDYAASVNLADVIGPHVAYFLLGGTALVEDAGQQATPLPPPPAPLWAVLVNSNAAVKDKVMDIFGMLKWYNFGNGLVSQRLAASLRAGERPPYTEMVSTLEWAAPIRFPELEDCRRDIVAAGGAEVRYCGPGPGFFVLYDDQQAAQTLHQKLQATPWPSLVTHTVGLGAAQHSLARLLNKLMRRYFLADQQRRPGIGSR